MKEEIYFLIGVKTVTLEEIYGFKGITGYKAPKEGNYISFDIKNEKRTKGKYINKIYQVQWVHHKDTMEVAGDISRIYTIKLKKINKSLKSL